MVQKLDTQDIVARICTSSDTAEAYRLYREFAPLLKDYKFIFAAKRGASLGFAAGYEFLLGAAICSPFETKYVVVLDVDTVQETRFGRSCFPMDYSISLDVQVVSHIQPYLANRLPENMLLKFKEVFNFIARDEVNVDPLPYMFENHLKLKENKIPTVKVFNTLKAYEVLRTLDVERFQKRGEVHSRSTENELSSKAEQLLSNMMSMNIEDDILYPLMYIFLLKMVSIQINHRNKSLSKKWVCCWNFLIHS